MKRYSIVALAMSAAMFLPAFGGGDSDGVSVNAVKVVGASLADAGTYGADHHSMTSTPQVGAVYTDHVAHAYGLPNLCPAYRATSDTEFITQPACTNHAVTGAAIHRGVISRSAGAPFDEYFVATPNTPLSQLYQLTVLGQKGFKQNDLLVVGEGSANDAATLVSAYLNDLRAMAYADKHPQAMPTTVFSQIISSLFNDGGKVAADGVLAADQGAAAGQAYMRRLAQELVQAVQAQALNRGAQRVVIVNTLDVTYTPAVAAELAQWPEREARALRALFQDWVRAYNVALADAVKPHAHRIVIADSHTAFNEQLAHATEPVWFSAIQPTQSSGAHRHANAMVPQRHANQAVGHALLAKVVTDSLNQAGWL